MIGDSCLMSGRPSGTSSRIDFENSLSDSHVAVFGHPAKDSTVRLWSRTGRSDRSRPECIRVMSFEARTGVGTHPETVASWHPPAEREPKRWARPVCREPQRSRPPVVRMHKRRESGGSPASCDPRFGRYTVVY